MIFKTIMIILILSIILIINNSNKINSNNQYLFNNKKLEMGFKLYSQFQKIIFSKTNILLLIKISIMKIIFLSNLSLQNTICNFQKIMKQNMFFVVI